MSKPIISIIVPVYNAKEYLKRCVDSLIAQAYTSKEIILVNDGSTDGSEKICNDYSEQYSTVQVVHKENGGLMSAWMTGVKASKGKYLCFVDSDDWIENNMLQEMSKYLTGIHAEIIVCNYTIDIEGEKPIPQNNILSPGIYENIILKEEIFPQLLGNETRLVSFSRCMKLVSRELYEDNMKFCNPQIRMGEDVNIMFPVLLDAERLVIMKDAYFYHYYFNYNSMVHKYDAELYYNIRKLYQVIKNVATEKCRQSELCAIMQQRADMEYIYLLMLAVKNEARGNKEGYYRSIVSICKDTDTARIIKETRVQVKKKSNQLIYLSMKHPNHLTITLLRLAMLWYYRR